MVNINGIDKLNVLKKGDFESEMKVDLISSNDRFRISSRNSDKFCNFKEDSNNNNNIIVVNCNNNQLKEKIKYEKNKCFGSCINQKAKATIEEYLMDSLDEMDYWDALEKDKRSLCEMYRIRLVQNHQISNLFIENKLLGNLPRIFLTSFSFDLCFYVNGLYFSEDYISERYQAKETETLLDTIYNSFSRIFIVSIVSWVIECIDKFILPSEDDLIRKIKRIIEEGEKENDLSAYKKKQKKYIIIFYTIGLVVKIFSLYHMVCVFHRYKYSVSNWILSSIISILIFNGGSMLIIFGMAILRFMALKFKSPQLYNTASG